MGFVVVVVLNIFAFLWTIVNIITVATDGDDPMKAVQTAQDTSFLLFITILYVLHLLAKDVSVCCVKLQEWLEILPPTFR